MTTSEDRVYELVRKELNSLGYEGWYDSRTVKVRSWCGRESHIDVPNFVVYVEYRGQKEPFCIIEAKALEEDVSKEEWVNQARSYALWLRGNEVPLVPYFIVYNGRQAISFSTITGNCLRTGKSLKDVLPNRSDASKIIEKFIKLIAQLE
jgi:type I site-specific restriction endonuclease